ncbi:TRAP transporter substrate-binding protein DctP [Alloalcanivorax xenomutans]|uniref:TRAP transporter substrate-binding protein n=1 Tax=Alloalcanivorax xenomutans TaxID=1094342 RepID=UPI003BAC5E0E
MMLRFVVAVMALFPVLALATTFKISTLYPDGTSVVRALKKAGATIEERTEGRVALKIYPGGVMGDDRAVQRKIRIGQLHGQMAQGGAFADAYPDGQILNVPLTFNDYGEVDAVREELDPVILKGLEDNGWISFGLVDGGFAYIMSTQPVASLADLQARKLWLPASDSASAKAAKTLGLSPIVLNIGSVLTSLQTGAIDSFAAPPVAALTLQWYARVKYITDLPLLYTYGLLAIDKRYFDRLSEGDQKIMREVLGNTFRQLDQEGREQNREAFQAVQQQGLETVTPSDEQRAVWKSAADKTTQGLVADGELSRAMLDRLHRLLDDYRAR